MLLVMILAWMRGIMMHKQMRMVMVVFAVVAVAVMMTVMLTFDDVKDAGWHQRRLQLVNTM